MGVELELVTAHEVRVPVLQFTGFDEISQPSGWLQEMPMLSLLSGRVAPGHLCDLPEPVSRVQFLQCST